MIYYQQVVAFGFGVAQEIRDGRCFGLLALKDRASQWASNFPVYCSLKRNRFFDHLLSAPMKKGNTPELKWKICSTYNTRLCANHQQKLSKQYNITPKSYLFSSCF